MHMPDEDMVNPASFDMAHMNFGGRVLESCKRLRCQMINLEEESTIPVLTFAIN